MIFSSCLAYWKANNECVANYPKGVGAFLPRAPSVTPWSPSRSQCDRQCSSANHSPPSSGQWCHTEDSAWPPPIAPGSGQVSVPHCWHHIEATEDATRVRVRVIEGYLTLTRGGRKQNMYRTNKKDSRLIYCSRRFLRECCKFVWSNLHSHLQI